MIKVVFHKTLLPYTNGRREIVMERDSYLFIYYNCLNLFPALEKITKSRLTNEKEDLVLVANNKIITLEQLVYFPAEETTVYLVPVLGGGDPVSIVLGVFAFSTFMNLAMGYSFGDALLRGFISAAFFFAGAYIAGPAMLGLGSIGSAIVSGLVATLGTLVANAITGPPPAPDSVDAGNKVQSDIFGSISNTNNEGAAIPLIYGMTRVGGHYISSNIETATDQRYPDPIIENTGIMNLNTSPDGIRSVGWEGYDTSAGPPSPSTSTTDYGGESLTPDQY